MKKILQTLALVFISANVFSQSTIAKWTFTDVLTPSEGMGKVKLIGGITNTYAAGFAGAPDRGLNTATYPSSGNNSKKAGLEFSITSTNLQNLSLSFQLRHSSTSANTEVVQYSTDSINFIDKETFTITPTASSGDTWYARTVDFSSITSLNNKSKIYIRIVSAFDVTSGNYLATKTGSTYGTAGTWRFDNVTFTGTPIGSSKINYSLFVNKSTTEESQAETIKIKVTSNSAPLVNQKIGLSFSGDANLQDYSLAPGFDSLTISAGNLSDSTYITIKNDNDIESNEKLIINSSSVSFGLDGSINDTILILDDDIINATPLLSLSLSKKLVAEKNVAPFDTVFFKIKPKASTFFPTNAILDIKIGGNNITLTDYKLNSNNLVLNSTDSVAIGYFTIENDNLEETSEKLNIGFTLSGYNSIIVSDTVSIEDNDLLVTKISAIQGTKKTTPLNGTVVTVKAIVTAVFSGKGGYYLQESELNYDNDSLTAEGIFVKQANPSVKVGDLVILKGTVSESFDLTTITPTSTTVVSQNQTLPKARKINLPLAHDSLWESYEGMLVTFPQTLTVSEVYSLGRYGEITLSQGGRLKNPTNILDPNDAVTTNNTYSGQSNVSAILTENNNQLKRKILLEDNNDAQNPDPTPYLNPSDSTLRCGTTTNNVTGILSYGFNLYRILPTQNPVFNYSPRPTPPVNNNAHNVKIASFNVLNFFNGNGTGGGFPTSRGATTLAEFNVQKTKLVKAIAAINADVVGLMEMENDGDGSTSAIAELVNSLNSTLGAGTYAFVKDPTGANGNAGTDAIKVAFIYKPAIVSLRTLSKASTNSIFDRPPLAQTFTLNANDAVFTVITNHFKSKSTSAGPTGLDIDQNDGQGAYNNRRTLQAKELNNFVNDIIQTTGDSDVVIMGDFNAYNQEDPIDYFRSAGFINSLEGDDVYSYVFNGQTGSLDHTMYSSTLNNQFSNAAKWHINADEPIILDYNTEFKSVNQNKLNQNTPFRCSDHDPVIAWFNLKAPILTGTENLSRSNVVRISPNPCENILNISSTSEIVKIQIVNTLGENIAEASNSNTIDTSNLATGIYLLKVITSSGDFETIKFEKK